MLGLSGWRGLDCSAGVLEQGKGIGWVAQSAIGQTHRGAGGLCPDNVRIKRFGPLMHLKAYEIDGELLRTGSASFMESRTISPRSATLL